MSAAPIDLEARLDKRSAPYSRVPSPALRANLRAEAWRVLVALGLHVDAAGHCYPGRTLLAAEARVAQRNLYRNFRDLIDAGLLRVNDDDSYTVIFEVVSSVPEQHSPVPGAAQPCAGAAQPCAGAAQPCAGAAQPCAGAAQPCAALYIEELPTEQPTEQPTEHIPLGTPSDACVATPIDLLFEEFWMAFPHRPGDPKRAARRAFDEIVHAGIEPALLIERARTHAINTEALETRYWMKAVKWLREECWTDEAATRIRGQGIVAAMAEALAAGPLRRPDSDEFIAPRRARIDWMALGEEWLATKRWPSEAGLPPDSAQCQMPIGMLHRVRRRAIQQAEQRERSRGDSEG